MIAKDQSKEEERGPGDTIYLDTATRATMSLAAQMGPVQDHDAGNP